jgi:hypothetical protein
MLSGIAGGGLVALVGAAALRWANPAYLTDLVAWAVGIIVAPLAAAVSASVMRTTWKWTAASVGFALMAVLAFTSVLDFVFTALLIVPGAPGPFQGRSEWSAEEVDRVSRTWLIGRHAIAMTLGVFGGAAVGVWLGSRRARQ